MKSKFPNTSILNIITQSKKEEEIIVFFHIKNVPDYSEKEIFWFENKGKNGKAVLIWEELLLKQWLVVGKDDEISNLLDDILKNSNTTIDSKVINFNIPKHTKISSQEKSSKRSNDIESDSYLLKDFSIIPRQLLNRDNLDVLSGLKISDTIKPLLPIGLYEQDFIYNYLNEKTFGIKEYRKPFVTFRGVRKTSVKGKGSKEIIGFYQSNYSDEQEYYVSINNESSLEIGKSKINKKDGVFKIALKEASSKGQVIITNNEEEINKIDFVLLQDIQLNIDVFNKTFKDAYGREFGITSKKNNSTKKLNSIYWEKDLFSDDIEAYKKLSDIFRTVFEYLGDSILIADPYFIGLIKLTETTNEYKLSRCQLSLINAITHFSLESKTNSFTILGCNSRANSISDSIEDENTSKSERRFENYNKFFNNYISQNELKDYFPTITFKNSKKSFHNRYIFSVKNDGGIEKLDKCVIFTNSFGNIEELDIVPCTDEEQINLITTRFLSLNNHSTTETEL